MPSSGRARMPHNNRMHSSLTLKMNGMWKNTIGYDPYAATDEGTQDCELARDQAKGLMALAKLSNQNTQTRGACKKCGMIGHLTYQCRNHLLNQPKAITESSDDSLSESEDSLSSSSLDEDARRSKRKRKSSSHHKKKSTEKKNRIIKELKGRKRVHRRHPSSDSESTGSHSHRKRHRGDSDRADAKTRSKKRKSSASDKRNHRHRSKER